MCVLARGATPLRPRRLVEIRRRVFYGRPAVTTAVVVGACYCGEFLHAFNCCSVVT